MGEHPLVIQDRDILGGIPVFFGTRVPVDNLFDYLTAGSTIDEFLEDFPSVSREQVVEVLEAARSAAATINDANPD